MFCSRRLLLGALLLAGALLASASPATRAAGRKAGEPLRFVIYGDCRDGHAVHRKIVALIMAQKPELVLQTGDLVHRGTQEDLWKIYDEITGEMRAKIPVYPSRGNHDVGGPGYEKRVTAPFTSGNKLTYSFDKKGCHFIALAIDEVSAYNPESTQYKWLEKDLAVAKGKAKHIFVFFHVPPYSIGAHGSDLDVRKTLCPLFQKYGVRAVFTGHDHNYYRTRRDGITYVVTGGGGAPLYPTDPNKGAIEGDKWQSINNIVVCEVNGSNVMLTALRADGTVIEKYSIAPAR